MNDTNEVGLAGSGQGGETIESLRSLLDWLMAQFEDSGIDAVWAGLLVNLIGGLLLVFLSWLAYLVAKRVVLRAIRFLSSKTSSDWDKVLIEHKVFARLSNVVPALVAHVLAPVVFAGMESLAGFVQGLAKVYLVVVLLFTLQALLNGLQTIYQRYDISKRMPIKGLLQAAMLVASFVGGVFIISIVMGREVGTLMAGLGAMVMGFLFVFKDAIMGLVAGIQIATNDTVRKGDWIEMKGHGIDGDVIDVSLTTVKVQNFDKTVVSIPTSKLITDACRNWRGMKDSGGRRIKRPIRIDMRSIRFADEALLEKFQRFDLLKGLSAIQARRSQRAQPNGQHGLVGTRQRPPPDQHRHVPRLHHGIPQKPSANSAGSHVPHSPACAGRQRVADRDLHFHRHDGLGRVRGDPGRYF